MRSFNDGAQHDSQPCRVRPSTHHSDAALRLVRPGRTLQSGHWWRDKREQVVLKAEDILRQIDATNRRIDQLVYELYGLTDDEIHIVEEATRCSVPRP